MKIDNEKEISKFSFKFNDFESKASILELPCVIESHKTLDSVNLFKSNNISQMLYVHPNNEEFLEEGFKILFWIWFDSMIFKILNYFLENNLFYFEE